MIFEIKNLSGRRCIFDYSDDIDTSYLEDLAVDFFPDGDGDEYYVYNPLIIDMQNETITIDDTWFDEKMKQKGLGLLFKE